MPADCTVITYNKRAYLSPETDSAAQHLQELGIDHEAGATYTMQCAARVVLALLDAGLRVETHRAQ